MITNVLQKSGIVLVDPKSLAPQRTIVLQYNPASLNRKFQVQGIGDQGAQAEQLRLKGPAIETIDIEAELDATDQLETGHPIADAYGIHPQIAALQSLINPSVDQVAASAELSQQGFMEVLSMESPLTLFIWSKQRVLPVKITDFGVTEEAFDSALNPIRAKVSLGMRVLTFDDLGFGHKGGGLYFGHMVQQELLAALSGSASPDQLGVGDLL